MYRIVEDLYFGYVGSLIQILACMNRVLISKICDLLLFNRLSYTHHKLTNENKSITAQHSAVEVALLMLIVQSLTFGLVISLQFLSHARTSLKMH